MATDGSQVSQSWRTRVQDRPSGLMKGKKLLKIRVLGDCGHKKTGASDAGF
jgi:hypothetical protein